VPTANHAQHPRPGVAVAAADSLLSGAPPARAYPRQAFAAANSTCGRASRNLTLPPYWRHCFSGRPARSCRPPESCHSERSVPVILLFAQRRDTQSKNLSRSSCANRSLASYAVQPPATRLPRPRDLPVPGFVAPPPLAAILRPAGVNSNRSLASYAVQPPAMRLPQLRDLPVPGFVPPPPLAAILRPAGVNSNRSLASYAVQPPATRLPRPRDLPVPGFVAPPPLAAILRAAGVNSNRSLASYAVQPPATRLPRPRDLPVPGFVAPPPLAAILRPAGVHSNRRPAAGATQIARGLSGAARICSAASSRPP
jgi:hypothetical protein